jgi:alpha-ketoglutarate-dependent taurine dioxygenase
MLALDFINAHPLHPDQRLPWVLEPEPGARVEPGAVCEWAARNRGELEARLLAHGGILLRGFGLRTASDFQALLSAMGPELMAYVGGNSPRTAVLERIYTSTEYPAEFDMVLHNELACAHAWPARISFFCETPPESGGETPILDCRRVLPLLEPATRALFESRRVSYIRNLRSKERLGVGKTWQDAFGTTDRAQVEELLRRSGTEFRWNAAGGLWTCVTREALTRHPRTGEDVWFNQVLLFHPSSLDDKIRRIHELIVKQGGGPDDAPLYCRFEDGSPIPDAVIQEVRRVISSQEVLFPWRQGDVLVLDNMLAAHGRRAFRGPRRILVGMS